MKTSMTSMKRAFILFWHGLTSLLAGIANWFTVILGMKDDSKYGKFIRRVVGTCFAMMTVFFAAAVIYGIGKAFYEELPHDISDGDDYYDSRYLSRNATYYSREYGYGDGYVKTADGEKTIRGIHWIAKPLGHDSLVCYSDGKKRGYFNIFTGKPVIEPQYNHAWIFSEGLASVDDNGWIKFIDTSGKVAIDLKIPYLSGADGYVFHNGYCVVHDNLRDRVGLIDRQGNWKLKPEYTSIVPRDTLWLVENGKQQSVLSSSLRAVVPFMEARIYIIDGMIDATLSDHTLRRYDMDGNLVEDFFISNMEYLEYETSELRYGTTTNYDDEGNAVSETEDSYPSHVLKTAKCMRYEAESGWYGLITADGKVITPPSYSSITAVGYDLYLCEDIGGDGILLNGKGERVH